MLTVYLFSLILGGGLLLLSVLGGDGGEGELDVDFDGGFDGSLDGAFDGDLDVTGDTGVDAKIFSIRSAIYTLFGFGATGSLLTWLEVGTALALPVSILTGLASGAMIGAVFAWLQKTDSGAHPGNRSLVGTTGRITLPLAENSPGTVIVTRGGRDVQLRALPHDSGDGDPNEWRQVMVVEIDSSGVARVAPFSSEELTSG